jgi:hypothetical protein
MVHNVLIYAALLPLAVAGLTTIVCRRLRVPPRVSWAAGAGLGYCAGQLGLTGGPGPARAFSALLRPREAVDWLPHALLLAIGITILASYVPRAWRRLPVFLAAVLVVGLPLRLLAGTVYVTQRWSALEKLSYLTLLAATLGLTWLLLGATRDEDHPRLRALLLILVVAGAAVVISLSGVFVYGQLGGALAASLAGTALATFSYAPTRTGVRVGPSPVPAAHLTGADGTAGVLALALGGLVLLSCFYANLTPTNAALLFLALFMAGGPQPSFVSAWQPWQQSILRTCLSLFPLAIALARSITAAQAGMAAGPY